MGYETHGSGFSATATLVNHSVCHDHFRPPNTLKQVGNSLQLRQLPRLKFDSMTDHSEACSSDSPFECQFFVTHPSSSSSLPGSQTFTGLSCGQHTCKHSHETTFSVSAQAASAFSYQALLTYYVPPPLRKQSLYECTCLVSPAAVTIIAPVNNYHTEQFGSPIVVRVATEPVH